MSSTPKKEAAPPESPAPVTSIVKPSNDPLLEKLKSKRLLTIAGVDTNSESYPLLRMVEANDYLRLHQGLLLVARVVLRDRTDQGHEAIDLLIALIDEDHGDGKLAEREDPSLPLGTGDQAVRRVLSLSKLPPQKFLDNNWNERLLMASRTGKAALDRRSPRAARRKVWTATRSTPRCDQDAFPGSELAETVARRDDHQRPLLVAMIDRR